MALNHPNIVTIFDIGQANERHFIATEFVEGQTLLTALDRARLAPLQALEIAIQIARALEAAHATGIAHRDIKPENIMLRPDGYVKVLDFGLAKLTEPGSAHSSATSEDATHGSDLYTSFETRTGVLLGTISYMSPEQARCQRVDARTDIFSLGVLLYEMLTRHRPFEGATRHHVMVAILDQAPPPLAQHWPGAPAALQQIVERALAKDRSQRYQTASEFRADLQKLKRKLDVTTRLQLPGRDNLLLKSAAASLSAQPLHHKIVKVAAVLAVLLTGLGFPLWQWLSQ
jgi:eukaryotic-like serine/threonine-protein kinase